jgi:hypothetical protein
MLLPIYAGDSSEWVEDAYGLAQTSSFEAVASTDAFPYTLVWLLNTNSPYYIDCKRKIISELNDKASSLHAPPLIRY